MSTSLALFLIFYYLVLCIVTAVIATTRNRKGSNWFILGLILTPVFAMLMLLSFEDLSLVDPSIQLDDLNTKIDKNREDDKHEKDRIISDIDEISRRLDKLDEYAIK